MRVLVIGGGISDERDVSIRSADAVYRAVKNNGHNVELYDWDGTEDWIEENISRFESVLPIVHGRGGEDGVIQSILEKHGVPYLGSDAVVSAICFEKMRTQKVLEKYGYTVPTSRVVSLESYQQDELYTKPHVLKPEAGGSSIHTFIYPDPSKRDLNKVSQAFHLYDTLLLQQFVQGIEVTVPILEGASLPLVEIQPPVGGVFDYENKYNGQTKELTPPTSIPYDQQQQIRMIGEEIHQKIGCRHFSRIDMIVADQALFILEINTIPGMTEQSIYPKAAAAAGMNFNDLVEKLLQLTAEKQ